MILGRADNMIITGGRKVSPENIERRIAHLIQGEFIITSRPSDKWGREIVLHAPSLGDTGVMNGGDSQSIYKPIPEHLSRAMARILSSHETPSGAYHFTFKPYPKRQNHPESTLEPLFSSSAGGSLAGAAQQAIISH